MKNYWHSIDVVQLSVYHFIVVRGSIQVDYGLSGTVDAGDNIEKLDQRCIN